SGLARIRSATVARSRWVRALVQPDWFKSEGCYPESPEIIEALRGHSCLAVETFECGFSLLSSRVARASMDKVFENCTGILVTDSFKHPDSSPSHHGLHALDRSGFEVVQKRPCSDVHFLGITCRKRLRQCIFGTNSQGSKLF